MKFKIEIDCDNEAFADDVAGEIAKILNHTTRQLKFYGPKPADLILRDTNGNTVGLAWIEK